MFTPASYSCPVSWIHIPFETLDSSIKDRTPPGVTYRTFISCDGRPDIRKAFLLSHNNTIDVDKYIQARPRKCNFTQWYSLLQMLYMFQAVPPPIIRSSKLYTQHRVFVELFLLLTAIVNEFQLDKYPMLCTQF